MKLEGIRVLDLSRFLPGPLLTQMMADHGAEVIKVEAVEGGEPTREAGGKRDGVSVFFANTNRGKRSLALDLKTPEGVEAVLRLAERADVVVESFRPGVADRLGLGHAAVAARAPQVVYVSISSFGHDAPYRDLASHDLTIEAVTGALSITLGRDGAPVIPGLPAADILAATTSLSAVLMALLRRQATGRGDYVDMAMADCLLAGLTNNLDSAMAERRPPDLSRSRSLGGNALYALYQTRDDRWLAVGSQETRFAANILELLERPDLLEAAKAPPGPDHDPLRSFLEETFRTRSAAEWMTFFEGRDVPIKPVQSLPEALDDPNFRARGMVIEDERGWDHLGTAIRFADEPGEPRLKVPAHGQHSAAILRELGYSEDGIRAAVARGVTREASADEIVLHNGGLEGK